MPKVCPQAVLYRQIKLGRIKVNHCSSELHRFWSKVDKQGPIHPVCGQCWIWIAGKYSTGYGQHGNYRAHRYSWNLYYGEIPVGVFVLHRCDNPACVNPKHLFLGTHQDNMDDMNAKGRHGFAQRTHCPRNHEYDKQNTREYTNPITGQFMRACRKCDSVRKQNIRASRGSVV